MEVEFITLGDAAKRLDVPAPTLRHWTDNLEEYGVHFVFRNQRNERIYNDSDLKIFAFIRDLKREYGRKTTTKDLAYMLVDRAKKGEFELRSREEVPEIQPSNRTSELLSHDDIKRLIGSERVKQFMDIITRNIREELISEIRETVKQEMKDEIEETNKKIEETQEMIRRMEESIQRRDDNLMTYLRDIQEKQKGRGILSKLFGK